MMETIQERSAAVSSSSLPQLEPRTLADRVYEALRTLILAGGVEPGGYMRELDVSKRMGVSRTPVREALGRLASEGFLERIPHHGFRVPADSFRDLLDLYPVVSALELLAGKEAFPRLTPGDLRHLRRINEELEEAMNRNDNVAAINLNNRFHHLLCEHSDNRRLNALLDDLRSQVTRLERWFYSYREHTEESIREHEALIRALESGEFEDALSLFETNWLLTYKAFLEEIGK